MLRLQRARGKTALGVNFLNQLNDPEFQGDFEKMVSEKERSDALKDELEQAKEAERRRYDLSSCKALGEVGVRMDRTHFGFGKAGSTADTTVSPCTFSAWLRRARGERSLSTSMRSETLE